MQSGQTLSPNAIFASQKAHAAVTLSLLLFTASTNRKDIEEGAIKFTCIALSHFGLCPVLLIATFLQQLDELFNQTGFCPKAGSHQAPLCFDKLASLPDCKKIKKNNFCLGFAK
jgi:hypothetical protein